MSFLRTKAFLFCALIIPMALAKEQPAKPDAIPVVAYVQLGRSISTYPGCDTPEGKNKICSHDVKSDKAMISYRPQFPSWVLMAPVVTLKNGVISDVNLTTKGVDVQEDVLNRLSAEYGKPKSLKRTIVQNRFGATFPKIEAFWSLKWGSVIFVGVTDNINEGLLAGSLSETPSPQKVSEVHEENGESFNSGRSPEALPQTGNSAPSLGPAAKPQLGVGYFPIDSRFAQIAAMDSPRGVGIARIVSDSAAAKAGLKVGDAILAVDGVPLPSSPTGLQQLMANVKPGTLVNLTVWRAGREITVPVQF